MRFVKTVENLFSLPQGFTRVEYLQSSGTQYIDTGYKPIPATTKFEFMFQPDNISGNSFLFGCRPDTGIGSFSCTTYFATGSVRQDWACLGNYFPTTNVNTKYLYTAYDNSISLNSDSVTGTTTRSTTRLNFNFLLCAVNTNGTADNRRFVGKVYFSRLWDNGVLVRDFIPCIDPLGVPCMYDLVGKKPYYNQGTGDFTVGRHIIPVEYLEGTGTQYIDTGVRGFADFEIGVKLRESVSNVSIFCGNGYRLERYNASNPYWRFRNNNDFYNSGVSITEYHVMAWKNDEIYADGAKLQDFAKTWNVPANMTLFGASASGSYPSMIYFCKLWNPTDGTLLRDFIPCKDENDIGFMFDKVSGECYLNNGTGNFAFGENKYKMKLRFVKDNRLPAGYTQVEYLESTGTQYIDTGVVGASGIKANVKFMWNTGMVGGDKYILGSALTSPATRFYFGTYQSKWQYGYGSYLQAEGSQDNTLYDAEIGWIIGNQYVKINGTTVITGTSATSYNTGYNLYLPSRNNGGSVGTFTSSAKIYYCKIYNNDILVRSFIPALDPTGTPCMYDLVTKAPFYNQGTGTFSYGKTISMVRFVQDVIPREYAAVNYIESTGTQYIDTGIIGTEGVLSEIDVMKTTATTNECFLGTWNSGSSRCWLAYAFSNKWYPGYGGTASDMVQVVQNSWTHIRTYITQVSSRKYFGYNINGTDYTLTGYFTSFTGQNTILMFAMNTNTGANYKAIGRIGTCKITKDGVLVRNFVPVVRRIDKVAGMWDTVTKQFFGNSGTGAFNFG